jgi:hypothetical protein
MLFVHRAARLAMRVIIYPHNSNEQRVELSSGPCAPTNLRDSERTDIRDLQVSHLEIIKGRQGLIGKGGFAEVFMVDLDNGRYAAKVGLVVMHVLYNTNTL